MQPYGNQVQVGGSGPAGFHLALYTATTAGAVVLQDLSAVADPVLSQRNNHYTLTDNWRLIMAQVLSALGTEAVIKSPTWNAQTLFSIDPLQKSATQPSPPLVSYMPGYGPTFAQDEEIQVQVSDTSAGGTQITAALWLAPPNWNQNVPRGLPPLTFFECNVTVTATLLLNSWSALAQLTFEQGLRAGVYAIVGARFYIPNALFFRFLFPRSTTYNGRSMRPGGIVDNAIGNQAWYTNLNKAAPLGVWGKFQTYELPQIEIYSSAAAASATYNGRLALVKLSDSPDPGMLGA